MNEKKNINFDQIQTQLKKGQLIQENTVRILHEKAKQLLIKENNLTKVYSPITICGDIHGQFYDLLELFKMGGDSPYINYLFLGDFVDRGLYSVESFLLLLTLKVHYPNRITLLRGNHESRQITQVYGFYDQCLKKYGSLNIWKYCTDIFDYLPLAATIDDKIYCVHGGLSPDLLTLDTIRNIERKQEIPNIGLMCDLMWSDPDDIPGYTISPRGAGYLFGSSTVEQFNRINNLTLICRAHQLVMQGYKKIFNNKLVTVWSAPNYCSRCGNVAAILQIDEQCNDFYKIFQASFDQPQNITKKIPEYFL